jgi:hypothetical protein
MCLHTSGRTRTSQHIAHVSNIRQHTSAYVRIYVPSYVRADQNKSAYNIRQQYTSAYVSIRPHICALYVSIRQHTSAYVCLRAGNQHTSAYVSIYVSIRQHTSAYMCLIRQHTSACVCLRAGKTWTSSGPLPPPYPSAGKTGTPPNYFMFEK